MERQVTLLAVVILTLAVTASAEEVFIHFEGMAPGDNVAGLGTLHQNLSVEPLNNWGDLSVIQTFYVGPEREYTVYKAPNRNAWDAWHTNNALEDRFGDVVDSQRADFDPDDPTLIANGFANTDCSWLDRYDPYWCPQEFAITFHNRRVHKFKMLMVDYGDFNPTRDTLHQVWLKGFENGVEVIEPYTVEYTTAADMVPAWCSLGFNPAIEADACDCQQSGLGHIHIQVHAPPGSRGFDRVELAMGAGYDPNVAFDSLSIGYVNLFDVHPVSCPNPLNQTAGGSLPAAILGTAEFDVSEVIPSSCKLEGVPAKRWATEDVSRPYVGDLANDMSCTSDGPDGFMDLTLKFDNRAVAAALGSFPQGTILHVQVVCDLANGGELRSDDVMKVVH